MRSRLEIITHDIDGSSTLTDPIELPKDVTFFISRQDNSGAIEKSRLITLKENGLHVQTYEGADIDAEPVSSEILREGWVAFNGGGEGLVYKFTMRTDHVATPNGD